jgi:aminopeptidase N
VTGDDLSLAMRRAIAAGFHRADQEELLGAYVQPYFDSLLPVWESKEIEEALQFARSMYPVTVLRQEVIDLTGSWLARDLPGPIRRSLLESQDDLRRAMVARAFNAS